MAECRIGLADDWLADDWLADDWLTDDWLADDWLTDEDDCVWDVGGVLSAKD